MNWDGTTKTVTIDTNLIDETEETTSVLLEDSSETTTEEQETEQVSKISFEYDSKACEKEVKASDKTYAKISVSYPVFKDENLEKINESIASKAQIQANDAYDEMSEWVEITEELTEPYECNTSFEVTRADDKYISIKYTNVSYTGGPHPNTVISCTVYNTQTGEVLTPDYFIDTPLENVKAWVKEQQAKNPDKYFEGAEDELTEEGLTFYLDGADMVFVFSQYEIAPYAAGVIEYKITLQ